MIVFPRGASLRFREAAVEPWGAEARFLPSRGGSAHRPGLQSVAQRSTSTMWSLGSAEQHCPPGVAVFSAAPRSRVYSDDRKPRGPRGIAPSSRLSSMHCRLTTLSSQHWLRLKRSEDMSNCKAFLRHRNCSEYRRQRALRRRVPGVTSIPDREPGGPLGQPPLRIAIASRIGRPTRPTLHRRAVEWRTYLRRRSPPSRPHHGERNPDNAIPRHDR